MPSSSPSVWVSRQSLRMAASLRNSAASSFGPRREGRCYGATRLNKVLETCEWRYLVIAASAFVKGDVEENLQNLHGCFPLLPAEWGWLFQRDALKSSPRRLQSIRPAQAQKGLQLVRLEVERTGGVVRKNRDLLTDSAGTERRLPSRPTP